ncbi:hypothetical protein GW17_00037011 [Ensete ventricosum]|nr:hypothetical protein GW17_00037011 [Ensete ventricosum]
MTSRATLLRSYNGEVCCLPPHGGRAPSCRVDSSTKATRPVSIQDLCQMRACVKDEPFQALFLEDLPKGELGALLEPCWLGMIAKSRVLSDSSSVAVYERGAVCPTLAKQLYGSTPEVFPNYKPIT